MNTPAGNTISTAEHAFGLMASLARNIPQAHATVTGGGWGRKDYKGVELNQKGPSHFGNGPYWNRICSQSNCLWDDCPCL